jgi:hypothetical protein
MRSSTAGLVLLGVILREVTCILRCVVSMVFKKLKRLTYGVVLQLIDTEFIQIGHSG